jgi:hypothetical protein
MAWAHFNRWLGAAAILLAVTGTMSAKTTDSAVITNSGSTIAMVHGPSASPSPAKSFTVSASIAKQFFTDLAAARQAKTVTEPCMKSASFGSSTYVTWKGWRSGDLSCPPSDASGKSLVNDVEEIRTAAGVSAVPFRQGPVEVKSPEPS